MTQSAFDADPRFRLTLRNGSATFLIALASLMMANLAPYIMVALGDLGFDEIASRTSIGAERALARANAEETATA